MKVAIMQPYFLPYIGYFQLIASVDKFVLYDNIKYTKKGWINRNRMLQNGNDQVFSLSLAKASDSLDIIDRAIASEFSRQKLLNQFRGNYAKAPYFKDFWPLMESIILFQDDNLFRYIQNSISIVCAYLGINTEIVASSSVEADHDLIGEKRVIAICEAFKATKYINPFGGIGLYSEGEFAKKAIELKFLKSKVIHYNQLSFDFVPWLSIVDLLFFNSIERVRHIISHEYDVINGHNNIQNSAHAFVEVPKE